MKLTRYNPQAEADLNDIAEYTLKQWGEDKRVEYIAFLETVCEQVLPEHHAVLGRPYKPRAEQGVLRYLADRHHVYFRVDADSIEILHIRHVARARW